MKTAFLLFFILILCALEVEAGLPPTSLKNQAGVKATTFNFEVPNNSSTKTSTGGLIETGNNNILVNPSFEHSTATTGWNWGALAPVGEISSTVIHGKQLLVFNASAQVVDLNQSSTLYNASFGLGGTQGLASCRINSTVALDFCTVNAGTVSTSNCVEVRPDAKWGFYKIPFILGATSNGLSIASDGAVTGTVYVDDCFVGAQDVKQDVSTCNSIECETEFSAKVSSADVVSDENYDWIDGNCTNATTGHSTCTFSTDTFSTTPNCTATMAANISGASQSASVYSATKDAISVLILSGGAASNQPFTLNCQRSGTDFTNAKLLAGGSIYSTASDSFSTDTNALSHKTTALASTDPVGTYNTFSYASSSNTKTICGTAPSTLPTKADGFKIYTRPYNLSSTCGNPARVEIKIAPAGTSLPTLTKNIYKNTAKDTVGSLDYTIESTTEIGERAGGYNSSTGILIVDLGFRASTTTGAFVFFSDQTSATYGYLTISAQKMKDSIVGDFNEVMKVPGVNKPVFFDFHVSNTGIVTEDEGGLINGNCVVSATSNFDCSVNAGKVASLKCDCIYYLGAGSTLSGVDRICQMRQSTVSDIDYATTGNGSLAPYPVLIKCRGSAP